VDDETGELGDPGEGRTPVRLLPDEVDVAGEAVKVHCHVDRARADDLVAR
jgi:hypothetical protein